MISLDSIVNCELISEIKDLCRTLNVEFCENEPLEIAVKQCRHKVKEIKMNINQVSRCIK